MSITISATAAIIRITIPTTIILALDESEAKRTLGGGGAYIAEGKFRAALQYVLAAVIAVHGEILLKKAVGVIKIGKTFIGAFVSRNIKIAYFNA